MSFKPQLCWVRDAAIDLVAHCYVRTRDVFLARDPQQPSLYGCE
jgi:hypothetical protein